MDLDFTNGCLSSGQRSREALRIIPTIAGVPLFRPLGLSRVAEDDRYVLRGFTFCKRGDVLVGEHSVVDAELIAIAAAVVVVGAFNTGRRNDARVWPELIERSIEWAGRGLGASELTVDIESDANVLIPCKSEMNPRGWPWKVWQRVGDASAAEIHVG